MGIGIYETHADGQIYLGPICYISGPTYLPRGSHMGMTIWDLDGQIIWDPSGLHLGPYVPQVSGCS